MGNSFYINGKSLQFDISTIFVLYCNFTLKNNITLRLMTTGRWYVHEAGDLAATSDDRRFRTGAEGATVRRQGQRGGCEYDGGQLVCRSSYPRRRHGGRVLQFVEALRRESATADDRCVRDTLGENLSRRVRMSDERRWQVMLSYVRHNFILFMPNGDRLRKGDVLL